MKNVEIDFVVKDVLETIEKYKKIFEIIIIEQTNFERGHNEVIFELYGTRFHILDENEPYGLIAPKQDTVQSIWFNILVEDIQSIWEKAMVNGCTQVMPITNMEKMGTSNAIFKDSYGYIWMLHQVHKDISFEEKTQILKEEFNL